MNDKDTIYLLYAETDREKEMLLEHTTLTMSWIL